jgi:type VI secretion system secreted protein VgrG
LLGRDEKADFDAIVGKGVTISVAAGGGDRFFHGVVSRFSQSGTVGRHASYRAEIVPWLWFLTRTTDCRIFQRKSTPDIVKQIFGEYGFADYRFQLGSYEPREYCVQYRETDFQFVSRLLEEEGIFYFFMHEDGKHTLVVADGPRAHQPCPVLDHVRFIHGQVSLAEDDVVTWFSKEQEVRASQCSLTDYNFEKPSLEVSASAAGADPRPFELYDYPAGSPSRDRVEKLARVRQQEEDATRVLFRGTGYARSLTPGYKMTLRGVGDGVSSTFDGSYVLTSVRHRASESYAAGEESEVSYENEFECIDAVTPFRPARRTPRPVIQGVQTAVVVGPAGEKIFVDKYGRVKVQFHWDREGKKNEHSSCSIRVSQNWAGPTWGGLFIPHVGQEVIVSFLEGDPDQPIITGRVYNGENMPIVALPAGRTKSAIRDHGGNEIVMEGQAGAEQIRMHSPFAQSTFTIGAPASPPGFSFKTAANAAWEIGMNLLVNVTGFRKENIKGPSHEWILGLTSKFIGGMKQETVVGAEIKTNVVNKTEFIKGSAVKLHSGKEYKHEKSGKAEKSAGLIQMAKDVKQFRDAEKKIVKANKILKVAGKKHDKADKMIWDAIDTMHTTTNLKEYIKADRNEKQATKTVKTTGKQLEKAADMKFQATTIIAKGTVKLG